jgi:phenylacetate-CoA ligase
VREILERLPIVEKSRIRSDPDAFRNRHVREFLTTSTSGSTGAPITFGHAVGSVQRRFAFFNDHLAMAGVRPDEPSVRLSGRILCKVGVRHEKPWLFNHADNQLFLSSYHLDEDHAGTIVRALEKFRPVLIDGYPSAILQVLRLAGRNASALGNLRAIITTAETLLPDVREEITDISAVPILDYYSASEGVPFIQQCRAGTYHVRWQSGIFELDTGYKLDIEGDGELVCTSFVQDRMPLIRYRTGDVVEGLRLQTTKCSCGLRTPTVDRIGGRVEDLVLTPDGRSLGMFTYRTLKYIKGLGETQVIQNDFADFEVRSVASAADGESLTEQVRSSFERVLGYPITLRFSCVDKIPKGPNGKVRLVISNLARKATNVS